MHIVEVFRTLAIIALVFVPLEWLLPDRTRPAFSLRRYRVDLLNALGGGLLIQTGYFAALALLLSVFPVGLFSDSVRALPLWVQFAGVLLVSDLGFWIGHRTVHAVPLLWRFHRIHHSSEHLDWLAAYRVHPVDQIFNTLVISLPVIAIGFAPEAVAIYAVVYRWHAILLHSNVRVNLGPLRWLVCTPQFHHWHHADQVEAYDRNFGGQLVVWDCLFGTANFAPGKPERYGVDNPPAENFATHMIAPFLPERKPAEAEAIG